MKHAAGPSYIFYIHIHESRSGKSKQKHLHFIKLRDCAQLLCEDMRITASLRGLATRNNVAANFSGVFAAKLVAKLASSIYQESPDALHGHIHVYTSRRLLYLHFFNTRYRGQV